MNKKGLTSKEKLFCVFFAFNGNPTESAQLAGYDDPQKNGAALLIRDDVGEYLNSLYQKNISRLANQSRSGYERLAFGSTADAVKLLFADNPSSDEIQHYDLFQVAEIKRPKEGALEIKFFDRIKALEKLDSLQNHSTDSTSDFYRAIIGGFKKNPSVTNRDDDSGGDMN